MYSKTLAPQANNVKALQSILGGRLHRIFFFVDCTHLQAQNFEAIVFVTKKGKVELYDAQ